MGNGAEQRKVVVEMVVEEKDAQTRRKQSAPVFVPNVLSDMAI